jgi:hypothetical protein
LIGRAERLNVMNESDMVLTLSNMTASQHKKMQKALRVLLAVGINQFDALSMIVPGVKAQQEIEDQRKYERHISRVK